MSHWTAQATALDDTPGLDLLATQFHISADLPSANGVEIDAVDHQTSSSQTLGVTLTGIDAASEADARERAYAALETVCREADTWRYECDIVFASDNEENEESVEIQDIFNVNVEQTEARA